MAKKKSKNRRDHYTPRGYQRGFIDPVRADVEKPLWHMDLTTGLWSEKSPAEVGWDWGFYDYASEPTNLESVDSTFASFEREFPIQRELLLKRRFKGWAKQQKPFFLGFMQMMRARSPLFFEHQTEELQALRAAKVLGVGPGNQVQLDSLELRPLSAEDVRDGTINRMRGEIQKGPDWLADMHWCLRYTQSPNDPFVTGTQALAITGPASNLVEGLKHPDTLIFFPICWQACLIGSIRRFDKGTDIANPNLLTIARSLFRRPDEGFLISPQPLSEGAFGRYSELRAAPRS